MRLVNIWAKSPRGTWSCAPNAIQLVNDTVTAEPLGKRFQSASGGQIYYPVALVTSIPLAFEISGNDALYQLMNIIQYGELYLDGAVYPEQNVEIAPCDLYRGTCVVVSGNVSIVTVSASRELYQVSFPVTRQNGQEASGEIPYFAPLFNNGSISFSGVEIVQDSNGTPFSSPVYLRSGSGKRLADGSVQLPAYTTENTERVYVHFYVGAQLLQAAPPKVLVCGIAGKPDTEVDLTGYFQTSDGKWTGSVLGIGITGTVTNAYVRMQCGDIDRIYRLRIDAPNFREDEI